MLVRADPDTKSISMMSFPRDLFVEIHCPGRRPFGARINNAYATCGTKGTLETVRKLTGIPINYLITVNFRGFRQLVDATGGIWLDVDRRYFNDRGGDFGYATINLFPGYQKLGGYQALDFVRYRHTDNDLYRVARQQLFVRAFKDQIKSSTGLLDLPKVIKTITKNVEVGVGGNSELDGETVLGTRSSPTRCRRGTSSSRNSRGSRTTAASTSLVSQENIDKAVQEFTHPDVESPQKATQVALNEKPKPTADKAPPPRETTITVLNGNGVAGSASTASYLLSQRGYQMVYPPDGKNANAPNWEYFKTRIHFDKRSPGRRRRRRRWRRSSAPTTSSRSTPKIARALERRPADRDRRPDLPRHARRGAGGQDAAAPAAERRARRRRVARLPARTRAEGAVQGDGADGARAQLLDRPRAAGADVPDRSRRRAQDDQAHLPHRRERVLGRPDDRLGGRARPLGAQLRPLDRRPPLRAALRRAEAAHGRAPAGRRELLGREHAARRALERDHARDRKGSQAARAASSK